MAQEPVEHVGLTDSLIEKLVSEHGGPDYGVSTWKKHDELRSFARAIRAAIEPEMQRLAGQEKFWKGVSDSNAAWADKISARHAEVQAAALEATRKCMAAWAAGEPEHRVKDMIDAVEKLQALVDPLHAKSEFDK